MADNKFSLVWTAGQLLYALVFKLQKQGVVNMFGENSCPVNIHMDYNKDPETVFASLHPCTLARPRPSHAR